MLILTTTSDAQTFTVIPRYEPTTDVAVTFTSKEQNKQTHSFTYAALYANGYLTIINSFDPVLVEQQQYSVEVKVEDVLYWRGRATVTDQTILPKFEVNNEEFTEPTQSDNEFIIIEE